MHFSPLEFLCCDLDFFPQTRSDLFFLFCYEVLTSASGRPFPRLPAHNILYARQVSPCQKMRLVSDRASTKLSPSRARPRASTDARGLLPRGTPSLEEVALRLEEIARVLLLPRSAALLWILLPPQVISSHPMYMVCAVIDCSEAAAAAKINADLQARKGIQSVDVPPVRSVGPWVP